MKSQLHRRCRFDWNGHLGSCDIGLGVLLSCAAPLVLASGPARARSVAHGGAARDESGVGEMRVSVDGAFARARSQPDAAPSGGEDVPVPIRPPQIRSQVDAVYPPAAQGVRGRVELLVTVSAQGEVQAVQVDRSAGTTLDKAAIEAVQRWQFFPAMRGETPVASRIRIPFEFAAPEDPARDAPPGPPTQNGTAAPPMEREPQAAQDATRGASPTSAPADVGSDDAGALRRLDTSSAGDQEQELQVEVVGEREDIDPQRSASDLRVNRAVLGAAPRQEGADVLASAPGVSMGRGEGMAVAHNYMLRGFDAEHGQDIAFRVGGIPINLPSHIHGQGYSDLGFLVADVVSQLRVKEGVYDPRQGDFAVAGSIDIELGVEDKERGLRARTQLGSFRTFSQQVVWAPEGQDPGRFAAARLTKSRGFGEQRAGQRASAIWQHTWGRGASRYRALTVLSAANAALAGVVRQDDLDAGRVCWTCSYAYPTARAQKALSQRLLAGVFGRHDGAGGRAMGWGLWGGFDRFRIQQNFTGFIQSSRRLGRIAGRGDLFGQSNRSMSAGADAYYKHQPLRFGTWGRLHVSAGFAGRLDRVEQSQRLLDAAVRNQIWDERVDASILSADLGLWGDLGLGLGRRWDLRAGVRGDLLSYEVDDRLGNQPAVDRPQDQFIPGFRRSASGIAAGPRASVRFAASSHWSVMAAWGQGYRSAQARILSDGEQAPFTRVRSGDLGLRWVQGQHAELSLSGYWTELSDDVAFEAQEGRLERIGATRRMGAVAYALWRPVPWSVTSLSVTGVHASLRQPPPPTPEEPQPPFSKGQRLPYVPPVVLRFDAGVEPPLPWRTAGKRWRARAGLGYSMWSPRPLPYGQWADSVHLLDASLSVGWGPIRVGGSVFNAIDRRYAAVEYNFASDWNPTDGLRPRTPERHRSVGSPRAWSGFLEIKL